MGKTVKSFEAALRRLEEIVETLESGELSLEESIRIFEEGVGLTRTCGQQLEQAEQKVSSLLAEAEGKAAPPQADTPPIPEEGSLFDGQ
jgi:exodeoxyribonuclease VII small subunit